MTTPDHTPPTRRGRPVYEVLPGLAGEVPPQNQDQIDAAGFFAGTEQDARVLRRARMLPEQSKGPLSEDHLDSVRVAVRRAKSELSITNAALAREIGVSDSLVSQFLGANYAGDNDKLARALNAAVERLARAQESRLPDHWFPFEQATSMLRVIEAAVTGRKLGLITAPSGGCKTTVLEAAVRLNPGSVYARVDCSSKSAGGMLRNIAIAAGTAHRCSIGQVLHGILDELRGTSRVLLIDEAQQATDRALEAVRDIHDLARVPVVLAGTEELALQVDDRARWLGQLRSRITHRFHAGLRYEQGGNGEGPGAEPTPMFTVAELTAWMSKRGLRLTDDGAQMLFVLANIPEYGCLRFCNEVVERARTHRAYRGNRPLDARIIRSTAAIIHKLTFNQTLDARVSQLRLPSVAAA